MLTPSTTDVSRPLVYWLLMGAYDSETGIHLEGFQGFRRDRKVTHDVEEVSGWQLVRTHELEGTAAGWVQDAVEQELLADLEAQLRALEARLGPDELLVVESEAGVDYPKTTTQQKTVAVDGENRFHFTSTLRPPLRVAVYRKSRA